MKQILLSIAITLISLVGVTEVQAAKPNKKNKKTETVAPVVTIPEESYSVVTYTVDEMPAVASINAALANYEHKNYFEWNCSLIVECKELVENGMPSPAEMEVLNGFEDELSKGLAGEGELPNAIFFARITHNGTRQLIWKVSKPKQAYDYLANVMKEDQYPRNFEFVIERDVDWKKTENLAKMVQK